MVYPYVIPAVVEVKADVDRYPAVVYPYVIPAVVDVKFAIERGRPPLTEEKCSAKVLSVWALEIPATSRAAPGDAVWIPTLELVLMTKAGVTLEEVGCVEVSQSLADTPVSITKVPVVWIRTRSEVDDPLKTKNSWVPDPVLTSDKTVLLKLLKRPK